MGGKIDEIREALIDFKSEAGVTKLSGTIKTY